MTIKSSLLVKFVGSEGAGGAISLAPSVHGVQRCARVRDP